MKKGRADTMTHDYKRHGTTTLFAAFNIATGKVAGECMPRHRHQEFLRFLGTIDRNTPKSFDLQPSSRPGHSASEDAVCAGMTLRQDSPEGGINKAARYQRMAYSPAITMPFTRKALATRVRG
jgi:hypothetical protein